MDLHSGSRYWLVVIRYCGLLHLNLIEYNK